MRSKSPTKLEKKAGDLIWFYLEVQNDDPRSPGDRLAGRLRGPAQETYETSLMINKIRHAFKHSGRDQRPARPVVLPPPRPQRSGRLVGQQAR